MTGDEVARSAATSALRASTARFLRAYPPFDRLTAQTLDWLAAQLALAYFRHDTTIVARGSAPTVPLHIVQRGHVASEADDAPAALLAPGDCFPLGALTAGAPTSQSYRAVGDTFCYLLPMPAFGQLREQSRAFDDFCTQALASLARQSLVQLQASYVQGAAEQQDLARPLRELVRRAPVACTVDTPLRDALARMRDAGVGTIAVTDAHLAPAGLFTLHDLRDRVVLADVALDVTMAEVMTPCPLVADADTTAGDAVARMADAGVHRMVVVDARRVIGVVSERDLFALQRVSLRDLSDRIRRAGDVAALRVVAVDLRELARNHLAQGVGALPLSRTLSALHDLLARRVLDLAFAPHVPDGVDWAWIALGSEGRGEQTFASDQDNALVFEAPEALRDRVRERLLEHAATVNAALAELGFEACPGNVMARNPQWCLTAEEWRGRFATWLSEPTPEALLHANIFFDLRGLHGDTSLVDRLRDWVLAHAQASGLFLRLLVQNALETDAPLGVLRVFATDDGGTLDLKTRGTRLFVDAARAFALANGTGATSTVERLRAAGRALAVDARHVEAAVEAFGFLQLLRLRHQSLATGDDANRIDPNALNEVDQRMLREAFRQARKLQTRLRETYRL